ncbi:MAG: DUF3800 domain-containing protein [Proteobacteria bacterium]|nr:DUF3800 domain-containing protein [Desulfobulbaceae bacterium]MBU4151581.1 DUF3800 domain-containing protein [Pseudomonadota bacterium]
MKIEVYCDEAYPDLFSSKDKQAKYLFIGSLWLKSEDRERYKQAIHVLRNQHKIGPEFKWNKVSPSKLDFYKSLIDWFVEQGDDLRFRCIAIDSGQVDLLKYHENDQELGFYKFYYQVIKHWIHDLNEYQIFCDYKSNRRRDRLQVLKRCLDYANLSATISTVQAIRSEESVLIQLADLLVGIVSAKFNKKLVAGSSKTELVKHCESGLCKSILPTGLCEKKFNFFRINFGGVW